MGKNFNFTSAFAVCLALSALPLACGDDEEPSDGKGGSSTGGSAGKGGTTGTGGSTGGTAGKGGSGGATGGTAGKGGTGGSAGKGGTAGTAGMDGGMGGAEGGMGGEGGAPVASLCEQVCAGPPGTCQATCVADFCEAMYNTPDCQDDIDAVMTCFAADSAAASWVCTNGVPQYDGTDCTDAISDAYAAGCIL